MTLKKWSKKKREREKSVHACYSICTIFIWLQLIFLLLSVPLLWNFTQKKPGFSQHSTCWIFLESWPSWQHILSSISNEDSKSIYSNDEAKKDYLCKYSCKGIWRCSRAGIKFTCSQFCYVSCSASRCAWSRFSNSLFRANWVTKTQTNWVTKTQTRKRLQ